jgi:O-6-methylguanine DNA methyltransferase
MPLRSIPTPFGTFVAEFSNAGLRSLAFPNRRSVGTDSEIAQEWFSLTQDAVHSVLAGKPIRQLPPLDLDQGTDFQRSVWRQILEIKLGETRSYGEIARALKKPGATRAVGSACGANPIPLLIPCHRVLAANHRLGGFGGGLEWKRRLLAAEGIAVTSAA